MPIPFLIPILTTVAGAGLGALKGATDGKKGNLLSSMLIGGGLGAAGGVAGPKLMTLMKGAGATSGAANAATGAASTAMPAMGAGGSNPFFTRMMQNPASRDKLLGFASEFLGKPQSQQYPEYGPEPYMMPQTLFQSGPIAPASNTLMPDAMGGY